MSSQSSWYDGFKGYAEDVINGTHKPPSGIVELRDKLFTPLEPSARTLLRRRVRDVTINKDGSCDDIFFEIFGEEISGKSILSKKNDIVSKVFSALIREQKIGGIKWMKNIFEQNNNLLKTYTDKDAVKELKGRLNDELNKSEVENEEIHYLILDIARSIGMKIPDKTDKEDQTETEQEN